MQDDNTSLAWLKQRLIELELGVQNGDLATVTTYNPNGRKSIQLIITQRLRKQCRKGRVWKSNEMLTALKNASYGFDRTHARSRGGYDGIFMLTRDYQPKNGMMRRLFDRFIDKPGSGFEAITAELGCRREDLLPVRLVSHHMRLLGLLHCGPDNDQLVLVDYDDTKH